MSFSVMADVPNPIIVDAAGTAGSGYVLKAYLPGTTTSISIFIDANGGSPQASLTANADGIWEVTGNEILPYIDRIHKWGIFANASDAAANTPFYMGPFDNVTPLAAPGIVSSQELTTATMAANTAKTYEVGDVVETAEFATGEGGGGAYDVVLTSSVTPNTFNIIRGTADATISFELRIDGQVSVKQFGANGSGSAGAIQAALNASKDIDFGDSDDAYTVDAALVVRSGTTITGSMPTLTQVTALTQIFNIDTKSDISISGIDFIGLGSDYAESDANPFATAIYTNSGSSNISIFNNRFTDFAYSGIRFKEATIIEIFNNTIVGISTITPITGGRGYCVLIDSDCSQVLITGNQLSQGGQGLRIEACSELRISDNYIFDIIGQHGIYLGSDMQNVTVSGNVINNMALQGIKLQAQETSIKNDNINITGNVITTTGDQGIAVTNATGGTLQTIQNFNLTIVGNTLRDIAATAINVQNTNFATVDSNTIKECNGSAINLSACTFIDVDHNMIEDIEFSGIRDESPNTNINIRSNTIHNVGTGLSAGDLYGIFIQSGTELSLDDNKITDDNANMFHGIFVAGGDQTTQSITSNQILNSTSQAIRFASTSTALRAYKDNILLGTSGAAFNGTALPSVASATALVIPTGPAVIQVTGTVTITSISLPGHVGSVVTLKFLDVLTVTRGAGLLVASNFTTSINDTLTICCDGNQWLEIARSVN